MEPRQLLARRVCVDHRTKWRPGERLFIKVHALRSLMHLVSPFARLDCGFAGCRRKYARHMRSVNKQVFKKAMFFQQSLPIAHTPMMAFDEDPLFARCNHACRRKRPWADG